MLRNFGINLLRSAALRDDSHSTIIATSLIVDEHVEVVLSRWSAKTGQVVKLWDLGYRLLH